MLISSCLTHTSSSLQHSEATIKPRYSSNMDIFDLIEAIQDDRVRITDHAVEEAREDSLTVDEVFISVCQGELIENYFNEQPPRCLICSFSRTGKAIHSVWAYNEETGYAVLITVYRPDPCRWINWRKRV